MKLVPAGPEHEPALRALIARDAMPGWIRMAYGREPDFFHGLSVEGPYAKAFAYVDKGGEVLGMGTRAVKPVWLDGEPASVGYLGGLRIAADARRGLGLARAFRLIRQQHRDGRCPFYVTTITEDNQEAQRILTSGRAGLPHYIYAGRLCIRASAPRWLARKLKCPADLQVTGGADLGLDALLAFYEQHGPRRQLFPRLGAQDLGSPYLRGLTLDDFLVARNAAGEVQGVAALWDQSAYKQLLITGYAPALRVALPLLRPLARWTTGLRLPRAGSELKVAHLAFPCLKSDDPTVLRALLGQAGRRLQDGGADCLLLGFMQDDPLRPKDIAGVSYESLAYLACYDDSEARCRAIIEDGRPLHVEVASI